MNLKQYNCQLKIWDWLILGIISTLAQTTVQVKTSLLVFKYLGSLQKNPVLLSLKQILQ